MFDLQNLVGLQQMILHMLTMLIQCLLMYCRRAPHTTPGATVAFVCWLERSAHRSTVSHSGAARQTVQIFHEFHEQQNSLKRALEALVECHGMPGIKFLGRLSGFDSPQIIFGSNAKRWALFACNCWGSHKKEPKRFHKKECLDMFGEVMDREAGPLLNLHIWLHLATLPKGE